MSTTTTTSFEEEEKEKEEEGKIIPPVRDARERVRDNRTDDSLSGEVLSALRKNTRNVSEILIWRGRVEGRRRRTRRAIRAGVPDYRADRQLRRERR